MQPVIWLIGGTTEGRNLIKALSEVNVKIFVSVATEYGATLIGKQNNVHVIAERMDFMTMQKFIQDHSPDCVIDATHPYATIVTKTVQEACKATATEYLRLVRPMAIERNDCIIVNDFAEAVEILNHTKGNIFLTTGSKTLSEFTELSNYEERVALRILPMMDSLEKALSLGYKPANIVCMQGPFSETINVEMMKKYQTKYMVTKDSGSIGGFEEKVLAAKKAGAKLVVITREEEDGSAYSDIANLLRKRYGTK